MRTTQRRRIGLALGALVLVGIWGTSSARAGTIGPNCGTCQGSIYSLTYAVEGVSGANTTYDIFYTINTTGYTGGGLYLDSASVKVSNSVVGTTTLDLAPGAISDWIVYSGGINAGGCDNTGSGFECASGDVGNGTGSYDAVGGTLTWVFDITVPTGTLLTGTDGATIKARYVNASDQKVGALVSEGITLTPQSVAEPTLRVMLGMSLLFAVGLLRGKLNVA